MCESVISCGLTGGLSHVNHSRFMWSDWWFKPCVNRTVVLCGLTGGLSHV